MLLLLFLFAFSKVSKIRWGGSRNGTVMSFNLSISSNSSVIYQNETCLSIRAQAREDSEYSISFSIVSFGYVHDAALSVGKAFHKVCIITCLIILNT